MSFGKMNSFIDLGIMKRMQDEDGFTYSIYDNVASVRAYHEGKHGSQRWANISSFSIATDLFRFRIIPELHLTTDYILFCNDEKYDIVSVEDVKGRGMYVEVLAKKVVPTNG